MAYMCFNRQNFVLFLIILKLLDEGDVYGWGWNSDGQLGYSPEKVKKKKSLN